MHEIANPVHVALRSEGSPDHIKQAPLLPVLTGVLSQLAQRNDNLPHSATAFHATKAPAISFEAYLERIRKYAGCSDACFIAALIYIDRIIQTRPEFVVNSLCLHRLFFVSIVTATKFNDDHYYDNTYYAKVGGVSVAELNRLEVEMLFLIDFALSVDTAVFDTYRAELLRSAPPLPVARVSPRARARSNSLEDPPIKQR